MKYRGNMTVEIFCDDCLNFMPLMDSDSIDLTVTSPPYDNLRTYNGQKPFTFVDFQIAAQQLFRVTKKGGVVVWVVGDATVKGSETGTSFKQALYFKECGFNLHDTMIYQKINPQPMNDRRYNASFEYMFILSSGPPRVFNPLKEPCKHAGKRNTGTKYEKDGSLSKKWGYGKEYKKEKVRPNIFGYTVGTEKVEFKHPGRYPEKLVYDHIISWSNPADIVLDPFMGSGTTGKMAIKNGRSFIGIEKDPEYFKIAKKRINEI